MAFVNDNFALVSGGVSLGAPQIWSYRSTADTLATIKASAYFNDKATVLTINDLIYAEGSDGQELLRVTAVSTNVTTVEFDITSPSSLTGTNVADQAAGNAIGALVVLHQVVTAGGATADTDLVLTHKTKIIDLVVYPKAAGTAGDTVQVKNGSDAITDAMDINVAIDVPVYPGLVDETFSTIAAGGTLRITETDGGGSDSPAVNVYLIGTRVA